MAGVRTALAGIAMWFLGLGVALADGPPPPPLTKAEIQAAKGVVREVLLKDGAVSLELVRGYTYLPPEEVPPLLQRLGASPPQGEVLGALVPTNAPDSWASIITYDLIGNVPETGIDEIGSIDFFDTVKKARGPGGDALEGFAVTPAYDGAFKRLTWGEQFKAAAPTDRNLRHQQRLLGRSAVVGLTTIAKGSDLDAIRKAAPDLIGMLSFTEGNRYTDYNPQADRTSEYDLPGLITGLRRAGPAVEVETASAGSGKGSGFFGFMQKLSGGGGGDAGWFHWFAMAVIAFALMPYLIFNRELRGVA